MIFKHICHRIVTYRNLYFYSPKNCTIKVKLYIQDELKLLHFSSYKKRTIQQNNKNQKNMKDKKPLKVWENMTAGELAEAMNLEFDQFNEHFSVFNFKQNSTIKSLSSLRFIAQKLGWKFELVKKAEEKKSKVILNQPPSKPENLVKRPPVVTIMGHVDHGKTTLLDALRNSFVTQQEFGGITQHIGAFSVEVKPGQKITFIDTPGHAAFTAMRTRGAEVTDIVVLIIAADDGVMQQTVESIKIAIEAQVHLIVAVNKIDKPTALSIDDIRKKLLTEGIQVEEDGGDIQLVPISALKKINLDVLTEVILLEAELMNLKGDPTGFVEGVIIESKREKIGLVATIIVKRGTLRKEKIIVAGVAYGRVRRMLNENGQDYIEALPSTPVQVFGWKQLPVAGDKVFEVSSEKEAAACVRERENAIMMEMQKKAKEIIEEKRSEHEEERLKIKKVLNAAVTGKERRKLFFEQSRARQQKKLENEENGGPVLNIIIKGDVYGSLEVLNDILQSYDKQEECQLNVIEASVGEIKQKDLELAEISKAVIFAFNVNSTLNSTMKDSIREKNIEIRHHNVIYKLIDDVKEELNRRIPPKDEEKIIGEAEVLQNFIVTYASKKVPVAGSKCKTGQLNRDGLFKVLRNEEVIYRGKLIEMRHEKNVVKTIAKGVECGLMLDSFPQKFMPGDKIICYEMIKVPKKTTWDPGF